MTTRRRVVLAKLGMDAHWRGVMVVARLLLENGYEVIYLGHATAEAIAAAAQEEDAALVGLSSLSGNHLSEARRVLDALDAVGIRDEVAVVVGGTVPPQDAEKLLADGVAAVFGPGTPSGVILSELDAVMAGREGSDPTASDSARSGQR